MLVSGTVARCEEFCYKMSKACCLVLSVEWCFGTWLNSHREARGDLAWAYPGDEEVAVHHSSPSTAPCREAWWLDSTPGKSVLFLQF